MADFVKCETSGATSTPEIIEPSDIDSHADPGTLMAEVVKLRKTVEDLNEKREEDRQSILILQSQIDHMRGAKCTDSVESSLKTMYNIASYLWNQVPSIPVASLVQSYKKRTKKKGSRVCSTATSSVKSLPTSKKQSRKNIPANAVFKIV